MKRHTRTDPVTPELHAAVLVRDRMCVLAKLDPSHGCRDTWGAPHRSDDLAKLTIEHVHEGYGQMGRQWLGERLLAAISDTAAGARVAG